MIFATALFISLIVDFLTLFIFLLPLRALRHIKVRIKAYSRRTRESTSATKDGTESLKKALEGAKSFNDYRRIGLLLDWKDEDKTRWKQDPQSFDYDWQLILHQLRQIRAVRISNDVSSMMHFMRATSLIRNLGGITDSKLYSRTYVGTKDLIEMYTTEVVRVLSQIASAPITSTLTREIKLSFFNDVRQAYGMSALVLQGGAIFGLFHLGVVKALFEQDLLPRIISGSAVGALIAALVGIHDDKSLRHLFATQGINLQAFSRQARPGHRRRKIVRFLKYGYLLDVKVLENCVRENLGDVTFEEAFRISNRVLNITVSSSRKNELPRLLNYLTAPNVLIWSAACASTSASYPLYSEVDLLAKDVNGTIKRWVPFQEKEQGITWHETSQREMDSPHHRLSELFNVNHFVVSQAGASVAPFLLKSVRDRSSISLRLYNMLEMELLTRAKQLHLLGLWPSFLQWMADEPFTGDITIAPNLTFADYKNAFNNPTASDIGHWIREGERATWRWMALVRNRLWAECEMDKNYILIKRKMSRTSREQTRVLTGTPQYFPTVNLKASGSPRPQLPQVKSWGRIFGGTGSEASGPKSAGNS